MLINLHCTTLSSHFASDCTLYALDTSLLAACLTQAQQVEVADLHMLLCRHALQRLPQLPSEPKTDSGKRYSHRRQ